MMAGQFPFLLFALCTECASSRVMVQGKEGLVIAVRDSNFYIAKCDCNKPEQQTALGAKALAIGGYWVRGLPLVPGTGAVVVAALPPCMPKPAFAPICVVHPACVHVNRCTAATKSRHFGLCVGRGP